LPADAIGNWFQVLKHRGERPLRHGVTLQDPSVAPRSLDGCAPPFLGDFHRIAVGTRLAPRGRPMSKLTRFLRPSAGLATLALASAACGGATASSNPPSDTHQDASTDPTLEDAGEPLSTLDTPCGDAGLTGRELLAQLTPPYTSPFSEESPDGGDAGSTTVTFDIHYTDGTITCAPTSHSCTGPTGCAIPSDPFLLNLAVGVTFRTADGAFNEHFPGTATYGGTPLESVDIVGYVAPSALAGTFKPTGNPKTIEFHLFVSRARDGGVETHGAVIGLPDPSGAGADVGYGSFGY
jgi:hypothetical protein